MIITDKIKRRVAFYAAVLIFFILLPIILSYALGYKIDYRHFKAYKTGILYISSAPSGATVYVNGKAASDITPLRIEELKPGSYDVEVAREGFYIWKRRLAVMPNMVTKADKIVLFPVSRDLKTISDLDMLHFTVSEKNVIYYITREGLFSSDMDGGNPKTLSAYSKWPKRITGIKFSSDNNKLLFFSEDSVSVAYLNLDNSTEPGGVEVEIEEVLAGADTIVDAFWHYTSNYLIIVTAADIKVVELGGGAGKNVVSLYSFDERPKGVYYDNASGSIYFTDLKRGPGFKKIRRLYRIDLKDGVFAFLKKMIQKKEAGNGGEDR